MNTIKINNISTLTDASALLRVALYMDGKKEAAVMDSTEKQIVKIVKKENVFTITDIH